VPAEPTKAAPPGENTIPPGTRPPGLRPVPVQGRGHSSGLAGRPGSRQPYPPAKGRPGGRWSSAYTPGTRVPGWSSG